MEEIVFSVSLGGEIWLRLSESITRRHGHITSPGPGACPASIQPFRLVTSDLFVLSHFKLITTIHNAKCLSVFNDHIQICPFPHHGLVYTHKPDFGCVVHVVMTIFPYLCPMSPVSWPSPIS